MTASEPTTTPRRGRPRLDSRPVVGDPLEAILDAAARLVGERGVSNTSISGIAKEVGLTQSSVYYYFANKTEILVALMNREIVSPVDTLDRVVSGGGSPAVKLFRFIRLDVVTLSQLELDLSELQRFAIRDRDAFASYWERVAHMQRQVAELVRQGIAEGEFLPTDADLAATTILGNNEGAMNRFGWEPRWTSDQVGLQLAELVLRGLMVHPEGLDDVRRQAEELNAV
jgi:AcrR family transcriptional regulator